MDLKRVDIAVLLKLRGIPILIIEAKREDKYVTSSRGRVDPFSRSGTVLRYPNQETLRPTGYSVLHNDRSKYLGSIPPIEEPDKFVNIWKCKEGDYENALNHEAYSILILIKIREHDKKSGLYIH